MELGEILTKVSEMLFIQILSDSYRFFPEVVVCFAWNLIKISTESIHLFGKHRYVSVHSDFFRTGF